MIVSLVKTASELEVFARETEMATGNVEQLLRPTFEMYKLTPPQLPNPIPLTAYPLDFRAPEGMFLKMVLLFCFLNWHSILHSYCSSQKYDLHGDQM